MLCKVSSCLSLRSDTVPLTHSTLQGVLGSIHSGKSALVHRFLTGAYVQEESPEGGRFKKEIVVDGQSHLLLLRDEGGAPEEQVGVDCEV